MYLKYIIIIIVIMDNKTVTKYMLERKISEMVFKDNRCTAHFIWEYKPTPHNNCNDGELELKVVTINPEHATHFLLHKIVKPVKDKTFIDSCYLEMLQCVINVINSQKDTKLLHYAIGWRDRTQDALKFNTITSYFSGETFKDIVDKFFFEKHEQDVIIDSITLLPES